jgi:hypothetical protein
MVAQDEKINKSDSGKSLEWKYLKTGSNLTIIIQSPDIRMTSAQLIKLWAHEYYNQIRESFGDSIKTMSFEVETLFKSIEAFEDKLDALESESFISKVVIDNLSDEDNVIIPGMIQNRVFDVEEFSIAHSLKESMNDFMKN